MTGLCEVRAVDRPLTPGPPPRSQAGAPCRARQRRPPRCACTRMSRPARRRSSGKGDRRSPGRIFRPGSIGATVESSTASSHTHASGPTSSHAPVHPAPRFAAKIGKWTSRAAEPRRGALTHGPATNGWSASNTRTLCVPGCSGVSPHGGTYRSAIATRRRAGRRPRGPPAQEAVSRARADEPAENARRGGRERYR